MSDNALELEIQMDKKSMNRFLLRNNFFRAGGVCGILISLAAIAGLVLFWGEFQLPQRVILIALALMFTVIQPFSLLLKGWNQLKSGTFKEPFHYTFSSDGITVENMAGSVDVEWDQIRKAVITKEAVYLYMNAVSAFILPRSACGERYDELVKLIEENRT